MKKLFASVIAICCALSITASATVMEFKMNDVNLNIQNDEGITSQTLDVAPFTVNDRTMVPIRVISESFGAVVDWNEADETVTITKDGKVIVLTIGKDIATVDGQQITLDVTPFTENDRTMVPVRFVTEQLGYQVEYEEYLESVLITDEPAAMTINGIPVSRATYKMLYDEMSTSGYYENTEDAVSVVEAILTEMFTLAKGAQLTDASKGFLEYSLDYDGYKQQTGVDVLETTYTHLMIQNALASEAYNMLPSKLDPIDDETIESLYKDNYVSAKHILIPVMDLETGEPYSDKEEAAAKKLAEDIKKKLDKGEDFDKLMNEYSKDTGLAYYPNGYTFTYGEMMTEFEEAAFALKEGEISGLVETLYGYHIIKREPLAEITDEVKSTIESSEKAAMTQVYASALFAGSEVVKNQEVINSIIGK